jgi:cytochrome c biogenesis protein CcmG/thiol:disulfide interchange protein DsbE
MNRIIKNSLYLLVFLTIVTYGQDNVFYKNIQFDKIYSKDQYDSFKSKLSENLKQDNLTYEETFLDDIIQNDSIIKVFKIQINEPSAVLDNNPIALLSKDIVGKKFSELEYFQTLQNKKITFKKFLGKPILVNLWFTQCKPCVQEIPALNKLKNMFNDKINFVALTFNTKEEVKKFSDKNSFNFIHLVEAESFLKKIGANAYPVNILIDKNGFVDSIEEGVSIIENEKGEFINFDDTLLISKLKLLLNK